MAVAAASDGIFLGAQPGKHRGRLGSIVAAVCGGPLVPRPTQTGDVRLLLAGLVVGLLAAGCGGEATVSGVVTLDGQPLPGVHLVFFPKDADPRTGRLFVADSDPQGRFTVRAIENPQGGISPGLYRLALTTTYSTTAGENEPPPPERVPAAYRAGIDFEVPSGGTRDAAIALKSK